ncbi:patatin-like phospholipase family protein [Roseinatronobacter alkalisoli]|uniref:Patatin-like phospholipase family protein n=1 Tax=Roseinatronobacter alkalisoli TaxID=3028235 RepID=A0ABT5TBN3_9RHOB|nr:patatin-like phospholipase family protein [Roseinatronobacter sp. HJB301]MDD7971582.1 patatin-like phospholipase family protein [Roseinatronobacter sp. HJB301]
MDPVELERTTDRNAPALALSGGGFRATLYHCGALIRLNELGLLAQMGRIAAVSGGSITAARLAIAWDDMTLVNDRFTNLDSHVIAPLRNFCSRGIDISAGVIGALNPFTSAGARLAKAYETLLDKRTLQDLPDAPDFVFKATNLQTGRAVRFQKRYMADYMIGCIFNPDLPLSTVVAASSAFPPVLSPVRIKLKPSAWTNLTGASHFSDNNYKRELRLTDGGAYDNMALESVDDFNPVIVSDAGKPFSVTETASGLWPKQLSRILSISTDQARSLRRRLLYTACVSEGRAFAISQIDCGIADRPAEQKIAFSAEMIAHLAGIRTRLNRFSVAEQDNLINWGWLSMDVLARSYLPQARNAPAPTALPLPVHPV